MAFTVRSGMIVLHSWGRFKAQICGSGCSLGDLVRWRTSSSDEGVELSNGSSSVCGVSLEDRREDEWGWFALAAELKAPPQVATGGLVTKYYWDTDTATSAALIGDPLYCTTSGKLTGTISATKQVVGHIIDSDRVIVTPKQYIIPSHLTITAMVGDVATASHLGTCIGADGSDITLTKGNVTLTEGDLTVTKGTFNIHAGNLTLTAGNITITDGHFAEVRVTAKTATDTLTDDETRYVNCKPGAATVLTLPTAAAGKKVTVIHYATANNINILCGAGDKIRSTADGSENDYMYDKKGVDGVATLLAINTGNWFVPYLNGTWVYANT